MNIERTKEILGELVENKSDEEIQEIIDDSTRIVNVAFIGFEKDDKKGI